MLAYACSHEEMDTRQAIAQQTGDLSWADFAECRQVKSIPCFVAVSVTVTNCCLTPVKMTLCHLNTLLSCPNHA
jgi:hypothetical protein